MSTRTENMSAFIVIVTGLEQVFCDIYFAERRVVAPAGQGLISSATLSPVATHGLIGPGWSRLGKVLPKSIFWEVRRKPTDQSPDHPVSGISAG
jgi:hypothetical protein